MVVEERYTPMGPNHIDYSATITDPNTFTAPWTISFPLYRHLEENMQLLELNAQSSPKSISMASTASPVRRRVIRKSNLPRS